MTGPPPSIPLGPTNVRHPHTHVHIHNTNHQWKDITTAPGQRPGGGRARARAALPSTAVEASRTTWASSGDLGNGCQASPSTAAGLPFLWEVASRRAAHPPRAAERSVSTSAPNARHDPRHRVEESSGRRCARASRLRHHVRVYCEERVARLSLIGQPAAPRRRRRPQLVALGQSCQRPRPGARLREPADLRAGLVRSVPTGRLALAAGRFVRARRDGDLPRYR